MSGKSGTLDPMTTKTCVRCGVEKDRKSFEADRRVRDGLFSWCKSCTRAAYVERRETRKALGITVVSKACRDCQIEKPASAFAKDWGHSTGLQPRCRECKRVLDMLKRYNVTVEQYREMLETQGGKCAVCIRASIAPLQIDHDHNCCPGDSSCGECVRGLLCGSCNRAIGLLGDDSDRIISAATYVTMRGANALLATEEILSNKGV